MSELKPGRTKRLVALGAVVGLTAVTLTGVGASAATPEVSTPKNIIVMISDGGGYNQFDAARLYKSGSTLDQVGVDPATGVVNRVPGEATEVFDTWPVRVGQSHYSASGRGYYDSAEAWGDFDWVKTGPTDSAAAGTALGTGVKTYNGVLGFDVDSNQLLTVGEQAMATGRKLGLVTSVPFNHATPAGFIAHNQSRNDNHGIAREMIDSGASVIIGAGHPDYNSSGELIDTPNNAWIANEDLERLSSGAAGYSYIESRADFETVAAGQSVPERLFGLARVHDTFQYNRASVSGDKNAAPFTDPLVQDVPSLTTASRAALNVLNKDDSGFFLMIESGAVDWAGHGNHTSRLVEEQLDFHSSVEAVSEWVETNSSWDETLVIVTADHETGYLAGPGAGSAWTPMTGEAGELPNVSWHSGDHTNALVPVYAKGAGSEVLAARADKWDSVRGAYLDNTAIGETVFDFLGFEASEGDAVSLEAAIKQPLPAGNLSMSISGAEAPVVFAGTDALQTAKMPEVTVNDTRNEIQAQGKGWTVSGVASDFTAGNRVIEAANLRWIPAITATQGAPVAGRAATLDRAATLAEADAAGRSGASKLGAQLELNIPTQAKGGRYGSEITLTLFAQD